MSRSPNQFHHHSPVVDLPAPTQGQVSPGLRRTPLTGYTTNGRRSGNGGGARRGNPGCAHSMSHTPAKVTDNGLKIPCDPPFTAVNGVRPVQTCPIPRPKGVFTSPPATTRSYTNTGGHAPTVSKSINRAHPVRVAPSGLTLHTTTGHTDRTSCPARPDKSGQPRHGDYNAYVRFGCRCPDALEANRIRRKRYREGRQPAALIPVLGTTRRLRALAAIGYTCDDLSAATGITSEEISVFRRGIYKKISVNTAATIAAAYSALCMTPMLGRGANWARARATRKHWAPPLAWDNIDDPNARPDYGDAVSPDAEAWDDFIREGKLPAHEDQAAPATKLREAAIVFLTEIAGMSAPEIATHMNASVRQVQRYRTNARRAGWTFKIDRSTLMQSGNAGVVHNTTSRANHIRREAA